MDSTKSYKDLLRERLKDYAPATVNPKSIRDQANSRGDKHMITIPKDYKFTVPDDGGHFTTGSIFPLDNMKLNSDGKWAQNATDDYRMGRWIGVQHNDEPATEVQCDHKWVDVGFLFTKLVCSECNAEKKED